ncbi:MAG: tetratricopeptide repeat protein [Stappiaceae bacterium]
MTPQAANNVETPIDGRFAVTLFADIYGYARLMDENELETVNRVTRSIGLVRDLIGDYGGQVLNVAGDGILATFETSEQALEFAVQFQLELSNEKVWQSKYDPIAFRIGIAAGETFMRDNVLHGNSVNLAARIQELAEPGGICITGELLSKLKTRDNFIIESIGKKVLKNILTPIEVFAVRGNLPENSPVIPISYPDRVLTDMHGNDDIAPSEASLAVFPLDNLSGDPADNHICLGVATDIISNLTRFKKLSVTARHSAFHVKYQAKSLKDAGRRLGVRYIMTGNYRRSGRRIRINIELVECETENTLWSEYFDGSPEDIFSFEEEVSNTTATRLVVHIDRAELQRMLASQHPQVDAYGLILRGAEMSFHFRPESNYHARRLFMQARDLDPGYGRTYAAIARTFNYDWRYSWIEDREAALSKAVELARSAVDYDASDARGYSELGFALLYDKRHDESLAAYERAISLNPNDADLLSEMGDCLVYVGQEKRALEMLTRAIRLNPYHPDYYLWYLGGAYFQLGEYEKTISTLLKMHDQTEGHRLMASCYAHLGEMDKARYHARQVMIAHPNFTIEAWRRVPPNKYPKYTEIFIEGLRLAGLN